MRNIKMIIEYDGSSYHGFQKQVGQKLKTIQGTLEYSLEKLTGHQVNITGSGRTDAGVHAVGQVINFYTESSIPTSNIVRAVNSLLPDDIVAKHAEEVSLDFHSQFWAKKKTYRYTIYNAEVPSVFYRKWSLFVSQPLEIKSMKQAADYLIGKHDFAAFKAAGSTAKTSVRTMYTAKVEQNDQLINIYLQANGFLYNMVRIIVGTLIYIGKGKLEAEEMKTIIESKSRVNAGPTVPPNGLSLVSVEY